MSLFVLMLIFLGIYLAMSELIIPFIEKREFNTKFQELTKIGWLAAATYGRKFALIAFITYGGFWLLLTTIGFLARVFHTSLGMLNNLSSILLSFNQLIEFLSSAKTFWALFLLSTIAFLLFIRKNRKNVLKVYEKIKADASLGQLEHLEPNELMNKTEEKIRDLLMQYQEVEGINAQDLSPKEREERTGFMNFVKTFIPALQSYYKDLDIRRRILPALAKTTETNKESGQSKNVFAKVFTFFTSQGMVKTINKTSGWIGNLGIVFLLLSFLSASGNMLTKNVNTQANRIAEVEFNTKRKELKDLLKVNEAPEEEQNEEWTEDDEQVVNNMARHFEKAMANAYPVRVSAQMLPRSLVFNMTSNAVRTNVLRTYVYTPDGTKVRDGFAVVEEGQLFTADEPELRQAKRYSKTYADVGFSDKPETEIGKRFKEKFKAQVQKSSRQSWTATKTRWQAAVKSFSTTATPKEVLSAMFDESLRGLFDTRYNSTLEGTALESMTQRVTNSTLKNVVDYKIEQFTANVFGSESPTEAIQKVGSVSTSAEKYVQYAAEDFTLPDFKTSSEVMKNYQVTLNHEAIAKPQQEISRYAVEELESLMRLNGINRPQSALNEVSLEFRNIFPGQDGMDRISSVTSSSDDAAMLLDEAIDGPSGGGGGGGIGGGNSSKKSWRTPSMPTARARSFGMLRGFRRIGGVLIGHNPTNERAPEANFTDISWMDKGNSVEIFLHIKGGTKVSAGTYSKSVVSQALAYASDGRSIAATMIKASPIPFLKILVHPALVNTDMGCRIIGLDRLVDKYASGENSPVVKNALAAFQYQSYLYEYACMKLIANSNNVPSYEKIEILSMIRQMETGLQKEWNQISRTLLNGAIFDDPDRSHIAAKSIYYNQNVVDALRKSMRSSSGDFNTFVNVMGNRSIEIYDIYEVLKVKTEEWSGVREMNYHVDNSLSFLRPAAGQNPQLFPFEFIRQIVYNPVSSDDEENSIEQSDENPWEFPALKKQSAIESLVLKGINSDSKDKALFQEAKSFTLAQRLFRSAFNGQLGYDFPIEKLVQLAKLTRPYLLETETPTWNYNAFSEIMIKAGMSEKEIQAYEKLSNAQGVSSKKNVQPCN